MPKAIHKELVVITIFAFGIACYVAWKQYEKKKQKKINRYKPPEYNPQSFSGSNASSTSTAVVPTTKERATMSPEEAMQRPPLLRRESKAGPNIKSLDTVGIGGKEIPGYVNN